MIMIIIQIKETSTMNKKIACISSILILAAQSNAFASKTLETNDINSSTATVLTQKTKDIGKLENTSTFDPFNCTGMNFLGPACN